MAAEADRHLLFGLIALQVGIIDQAQLVAAFQAWAVTSPARWPTIWPNRGVLTARAGPPSRRWWPCTSRKTGPTEKADASPAPRSSGERPAEPAAPSSRARSPAW